MRVPSVRSGLLLFASPAVSAPPLPAPAAVDAEVSRVINRESHSSAVASGNRLAPRATPTRVWN